MRHTRLLRAATVAGCIAALGAGAAAPARPDDLAFRAQTPSATQAVTSQAAAAAAEAGRLLTSVPLPPGSNALGGEPPEAGGALSRSPNPQFAAPLVSATGWWTTPEGPRAAIEYVHAHLSEISPFSRSIFPAAIAPGVVQARIRLVEGAGVVGERWLVLTAKALPSGLTAMRGDTQVLYVAAHDRIPKRARAIRVTVTRRSGNTSSFLVTARRRVLATGRLIDKLPAARPSLVPKPCPLAQASIRMGFFASQRARTALAVATATIGGCGGIELAIRGKALEPDLQAPGTGLVGKLEHALGRSFPAR